MQIEKKLRSFITCELCACFILFIINILYLALRADSNYIWDSSYYWTVADPVLESGHFKLLSFPETFRGCIFTILICCFKRIFGVWGWRLLIAIIVSLLFGIIIPKIINRRIESAMGICKAIASELLFIYFWGDNVNYPLSDIPAAFFLMSGICLYMDVHEKRGQTNDSSIDLVSILKLFFCGCFIYAAYNTRVAFLYAIFCFFICIVVNERKSIKTMLIYTIVIVSGMVFFSVPQCLINMQYTGNYSPKVYTEQLFDYSESLQSMQLQRGILSQRYETYAGDLDHYPTATVIFDDIVGYQIADREALLSETTGILDILKVFVKYPLDMAGLYNRHLITLMTPAWNHAYIKNIYTNKAGIVVFSIFIWMISFLSILLEMTKENRLNYRAGLLMTMIFPNLVQLVGVPEMRFFILIYMILYSYVFMRIDYKQIYNYVRKRWLQVLLVASVIFLMWITIYGSSLAANREKPILINDSTIVSE